MPLMKQIKELTEKILVGSTYFFSEYKDFHSKDCDYVIIVDENEEFKICREIHITNKKCIFQIVKKDPKEIIDRINNGNSPMQIGKFIVPEFNEYIGFKYEDLPLIEKCVKKLDSKHDYERVIYEAYKENGNFTLTKEQRDSAYESYKKSRISK